MILMSSKMYIIMIIVLSVAKRIVAQDQAPELEHTTVVYQTENSTEIDGALKDFVKANVLFDQSIDKEGDLDYGIYTTMTFTYVNGQYSRLRVPELCYDHYTKCLVTQGHKEPVCGLNDANYIPHGYVTFDSYCDIYHDNCMKGYRYWRIIGFGKCTFRWTLVTETRRYLAGLPLLLKKLAKSVMKL